MKGLEGTMEASPVAAGNVADKDAFDRIEGRASWNPRLQHRHRVGRIFVLATALATLAAACVLIYLLFDVWRLGSPWLSWNFLNHFPSRFPAKAGLKSALYGSAYMTVLTGALAVPFGIAAAVYLEEFAGQSKMRQLIDINIANLAGVPSIVYGMLGLAVFVRFCRLDRSLIAGALTMSMLILPMIIVATREALRGVPVSIRHAALALGATKWQTIRSHVLPAATPGILTGVILAMSRATGETAPLLMIGALAYIAYTPENLMDGFTVLPIQIFNWSGRPQEEFQQLAAAGIIVLLAMLLATNALAIFLRHRYQGKARW